MSYSTTQLNLLLKAYSPFVQTSTTQFCVLCIPVALQAVAEC